MGILTKGDLSSMKPAWAPLLCSHWAPVPWRPWVRWALPGATAPVLCPSDDTAGAAVPGQPLPSAQPWEGGSLPRGRGNTHTGHTHTTHHTHTYHTHTHHTHTHHTHTIHIHHTHTHHAHTHHTHTSHTHYTYTRTHHTHTHTHTHTPLEAVAGLCWMRLPVHQWPDIPTTFSATLSHPDGRRQ